MRATTRATTAAVALTLAVAASAAGCATRGAPMPSSTGASSVPASAPLTASVTSSSATTQDPATSSGPGMGLWRTATNGVLFVEAPLKGSEGSLPWLDVGLPEVIDSKAPRQPWSTSTLAQRRTVVAAYLDLPADAATGPLVLVLRDGSKLVVDDVRIEPTRDPQGNQATALRARAFDHTGRYLAIAQPGKVVVLDLDAGVVRTYTVPSQTIEEVSWVPKSATTVDNGGLFLSGDEGVWRVNVRSPSPSVVQVSASPVTASGESIRLRYLDPDGLRTGFMDTFIDGGLKHSRPVPWPFVEPWGEAFTNGTQVTSSLFNHGGPVLPFDSAGQSVAVMDAATHSGIRTWLFTDGDGSSGQVRGKGASYVLGWSADGRYVLAAVDPNGAGDVPILALDPQSGQAYRASTLKTDANARIALGAATRRG